MDTTVVVTGGGTGIGRATALRLAADGRHVTVVGRRADPLKEVAAHHPDRIATVVADVGTVEGAQRVAENVGRGCDGIVAAAGGLSPTPDGVGALEAARAAWQAGFESNVLTAVLAVEALRPSLEQHAGRVVLLSSIAAYRGSRGGPYGAMKAALHGWVHDLAREFGPHGGTANVVAPGFVPDTEFWAGRLTPELIANRTNDIPVGRGGSPAEVASLIAWMLGPDGGWFSGQVVSPNGGAVPGR